MRYLSSKVRIGSVQSQICMEVRFSPPPPPAFAPKIGSKAREAEIDQITERIHSKE